MKVSLPEEYATRVEILPLIDIVFLLLVFFIYAMLSMAVHRGLEVELPVSSAADITKDTAVISVTVRYQAGGENQVSVDDTLIEPARLAAVLKLRADRQMSRTGEEPGVLLFADRQVAYQDLFKVLDLINEAGLNRISLQADADQK